MYDIRIRSAVGAGAGCHVHTKSIDGWFIYRPSQTILYSLRGVTADTSPNCATARAPN